MSTQADFRLLCTMQIEDKFIQVQEMEWPEGQLEDFAIASRDTEIAIAAPRDEYRWLAVTSEGATSKIVAYAGIRMTAVMERELRLYVLPEFQGQGLGRLMFGCHQAMAKRYGIQALVFVAPRESVKAMANSDGFDDAGGGVMRKEIR